MDRRGFLQKSSLMTLGIGGMAMLPDMVAARPRELQEEENPNIIGPRKGYSPEIGTLVSMMNWMRGVVLYQVRNLSTKELDYLHDENANAIGAMLLHLAATERFYQLNTFEGLRWGNWPAEDRKAWSTASGLGAAARKEIKDKPIDFYLEKLETVREATLKGFAERDDDWLMSVDKDFPWGPTNNYCKWFHVCEHESNHNGQIKWLKSRVST